MFRTPFVVILLVGCTETPDRPSSVTDPQSEPQSSPEPEPGDPADPAVALPYGTSCKQDAPGVPIKDAAGTFSVTGPVDAPGPFGVGVWISGTGSLNLYTCIRSPADDILDRMNFDVELVLFDIDDQPIDLPVGGASSINVLWGTVSDWDGVTSWADGDVFMHFEDGTSSFTELDKQGRLVGTIDVTKTDPPGHPMEVTIDLTW